MAVIVSRFVIPHILTSGFMESLLALILCDMHGVDLQHADNRYAARPFACLRYAAVNCAGMRILLFLLCRHAAHQLMDGFRYIFLSHKILPDQHRIRTDGFQTTGYPADLRCRFR